MGSLRYKFRAYDLQEKEFVDISKLGICDDGSVWYVQAIDENEKEIDPPFFPSNVGEVALMQYTGMKDKNDVEIYEGDIVKRVFEVATPVYDEVTLGVMDYDIEQSGYFIGVVSYTPSSGFILNKCRKYNDEGLLISKRSGVKIHGQYAEVIGNVFQDGGLLNDTQTQA